MCALRDVKERCCVVDVHEAHGVAARSREAALRTWMCMFFGQIGLTARGLGGFGAAGILERPKANGDGWAESGRICHPGNDPGALMLGRCGRAPHRAIGVLDLQLAPTTCIKVTSCEF